MFKDEERGILVLELGFCLKRDFKHALLRYCLSQKYAAYGSQISPFHPIDHVLKYLTVNGLISFVDSDFSVPCARGNLVKSLNILIHVCSTALEENMFDTASTSPYPQVFLRPRETVHIPFKFQTFRADQSVPEQVCTCLTYLFPLKCFLRPARGAR